jgi:transposase
MRELSVAEQRYQAVLAVIGDGLSVSQVAEKVGVSRQTLHSWLARYEARGLEGLVDRSHRPARCPHQMPAAVDLLRATTTGQLGCPPPDAWKVGGRASRAIASLQGA